MSYADILDKTSSIFFIMGTLFSKLRLLPFALFSLVANVISQILYLGGYILWFVASYLYPEHPRLKDQWYGFGQFKEQSRISAVVGTVASIFSVIAIFQPVLIIPALWFFFISNVIWSISHYHRLKNPPDFEADYSATSQVNYIGYAFLTTCVSFVTAFCITASILFPVISFAMLTTSTILGLIITLVALEYLVNFSFNNTQPNKWKGTNYSEMSTELSHSSILSINYSCDTSLEPGCDVPSYSSLFVKTDSESSSSSDQIVSEHLPDLDNRLEM